MKKRLLALLLTLPLLGLLTSETTLAYSDDDSIRVGLFYGGDALSSANLENSEGQGYDFGYYRDGGSFVSLAETNVTQITMMKTQNMYLRNDIYYQGTGSTSETIGAYHLQLRENFSNFQTANQRANEYNNAFPAWIDGSYVVRIGAYATESLANTAQDQFNRPSSVTVVGTSNQGINITQTKTTDILFQFDGAGKQVLAVNPKEMGTSKSITWFKGYRYYGDFLYERVGGNNLTVSNRLPIQDYLKGVLPYEMSASWPREALKAQAVCARTYTYITKGTRHNKDGFDICNSTCCQVYKGMNKASANSDAAVDETRNIHAYYQGKLAQTFYYAANGGASEDVRNVWSSDSNLPYLSGVRDHYETSIQDSIPNYNWSTSFTGQALQERLTSRGYTTDTIVDCWVSERTALGNVKTLTFQDSTGRILTFSKEKARTILGVNSLRFDVLGGSGTSSLPTDTSTARYYIDDDSEGVRQLEGLWSIGSNEDQEPLGNALYAISSRGTNTLQASTSTPAPVQPVPSSGLFTVQGKGNGHHVGMSQWGAYAMAQQGLNFESILKFYFVGIDLY